MIDDEEIKIPTEPSLYWEQWVDPYVDPNDELFPLKQRRQREPWESNYEEEGELLQQGPPIKNLFTPFGTFPLTEHSIPSKLFKFWTGHVNFTLDAGMVSVIESVPGVETLNIWSRYRFRVGIGKLFDDGQVMYAIKEAILKYYEQRYGKKRSDSMPSRLTSLRDTE